MDQKDVSCKSTVYNPNLAGSEATNSNGNSQPPNNFRILRTFARAKYKPQETLTCCYGYLETSTIARKTHVVASQLLKLDYSTPRKSLKS